MEETFYERNYFSRWIWNTFVSIDKSCTPHRYSYAVSREICAKAERSSLLQKVYKGAAGDLIAAFLKESKISEKERKELRKMLDDMDV